jgi:hypothetical protein
MLKVPGFDRAATIAVRSRPGAADRRLTVLDHVGLL